jgi:hypothetical protein
MSQNEGSKNKRTKLQEHGGQRKQERKQGRKPDLRIRRTCERLGSALLTLILERQFDDVTVQDVLDRASVGRSRFIFTTATRTTCSSASWRCFWKR